jgi:hypothetical protein
MIDGFLNASQSECWFGETMILDLVKIIAAYYAIIDHVWYHCIPELISPYWSFGDGNGTKAEGIYRFDETGEPWYGIRMLFSSATTAIFMGIKDPFTTDTTFGHRIGVVGSGGGIELGFVIQNKSAWYYINKQWFGPYDLPEWSAYSVPYVETHVDCEFIHGYKPPHTSSCPDSTHANLLPLPT